MTDMWDSKVLYQIAQFNIYTKRIFIPLSKHDYHGTIGSSAI